MDRQRFDELVKWFATGTPSRRRLVKGFAGGVLGLAGVDAATRRAGAQDLCAGMTCADCEVCASDTGQCVDDCGGCLVCNTGTGSCDADCRTGQGCCDAGETCNQDTGACEVVDPCAGITCADCEVCQGGQCLDDCGACSRCNIDTGVCVQDCFQDAAACCDAGQVCDEETGLCLSVECEADTDCGPCETCNGGSCESQCVGGDVCNEDTGECEAPPAACGDDTDCDPCQSCTNGACAATCSECESCDTSTDAAGVCVHDCRIAGAACACDDGEVCNENTGTCETAAECAVDTDCDPCNACQGGVCTWLCGEACAACDETSGEHGTCLFDCRAGDGNSCCDTAHGQICNQQTGQCEVDQSQFGTLVINKVDDAGKPVPGACFDLLDSQTGAVLTSQPHCDGGFGDFDGTNNGTVVFQGNVRGSFGVRESVVPAGYVGADDQVTPQIAAGQTVEITFVNTPIDTGGEETGGEETGGEETGAEEEPAATTLPTTGTGHPGPDGASWLTGVAFIGAAAALLGGRKLRPREVQEDEEL
jgi:hypothetical protein